MKSLPICGFNALSKIFEGSGDLWQVSEGVDTGDSKGSVQFFSLSMSIAGIMQF